jgi:alkaline phosphatase
LIDRGEGKMPGMKHNATDHSNALVPIYARGDGAYLFMKSIAGKDEKAAALWNNSGEYVENTTIFTVMKAAVQHPATEARENEKR